MYHYANDDLDPTFAALFRFCQQSKKTEFRNFYEPFLLKMLTDPRLAAKGHFSKINIYYNHNNEPPIKDALYQSLACQKNRELAIHAMWLALSKLSLIGQIIHIPFNKWHAPCITRGTLNKIALLLNSQPNLSIPAEAWKIIKFDKVLLADLEKNKNLFPRVYQCIQNQLEVEAKLKAEAKAEHSPAKKITSRDPKDGIDLLDDDTEDDKEAMHATLFAPLKKDYDTSRAAFDRDHGPRKTLARPLSR